MSLSACFFFLGKFATESEALTKNVNVCI